MAIGTNHTEFDTCPTLASEIANRFAAALPTESTYTTHKHWFALKLRRRTGEAGINVTDTWVGTNRCAVQSQGGITLLKREPAFRGCQSNMDALLYQLIAKLQPINVVLFGEHAKGLYFARRDNSTPVWTNDGETKVIPLPHLSFRRSPSEIVDKLRAEFVRVPALK